MSVSRRDFLRLRTWEQERTLEISCRTLYMRCSDAAITPPSADDYEQSVGEPPAVLSRRTPDEIFDAIERDLQTVRVLRLVEPEWLDNMEGGARLRTIVSAFRARGGRVERVS